jgi:hypothetical protein
MSSIAGLNRRRCERQQRPPPVATALQLFDRSPICTLALAHYIGRPISPMLAAEVDRVVADGVNPPRVFFVHLLRFVTPTTARRISYPQSVGFERLHQQAYRNHGFELVDVPTSTVEGTGGTGRPLHPVLGRMTPQPRYPTPHHTSVPSQRPHMAMIATLHRGVRSAECAAHTARRAPWRESRAYTRLPCGVGLLPA